MREHGGNLDAAIATWGGASKTWIDLSTGINPRSYPLPELPARCWAALPTRSEIAALADAARHAYGGDADPVPLAGAQAGIQLVPRLARPGRARVLGPTYNEHAASLAAAGWRTEVVGSPADLAGADLAVVVNPNNPDGRRQAPQDLLSLAARVGLLVVDESFVEVDPGLSLAPHTGKAENIVVLRSFGKFYGLAGLRLGFALAGDRHAAALREMAGPWPVSGPAIAIGCAALADDAWRDGTSARLARDAARLDQYASAAGWHLVGGTDLFRLYRTADAAAAQERLARARIWSRTFDHSPFWLRLGLPDGAAAWDRLGAALAAAPPGGDAS